jgi:hypothetical protein
MASDSDSLIATLKRVIDEQHTVNVDLRERLQEATAAADHWQTEAETWEVECQRLTKLLAESVHIPWAKFDEIVRDLENGNAGHALELLRRESHS